MSASARDNLPQHLSNLRPSLVPYSYEQIVIRRLHNFCAVVDCVQHLADYLHRRGRRLEVSSFLSGAVGVGTFLRIMIDICRYCSTLKK